MDYGELLSAAWRVTWRHKYLWILGLFAATPSACGNGSSLNWNAGDVGDFSFQGRDFADFLTDNLGLIVALIAGVLALSLLFFVISLLTGAGLVSGADEAQAGRPGRLGAAWSRGTRSFWRLLGLYVVMGLLAFFVVAILATLIIVPLIIAFSDGGGFSAARVSVLALAVLLALLLIPAAIVWQLVLNWAYVTLVLEGAGVFASLGAGWRLFRQNLGATIVLWVINVAVAIGIGLAVALPLIALAVPLLLAAGTFDAPGPGLLALGVLVGLVLVAFFALVKAVSTTFFTAYWTIAYRKLTAGPEPALAGHQIAAPPPPAWGAGPPPPSLPPLPRE